MPRLQLKGRESYQSAWYHPSLRSPFLPVHPESLATPWSSSRLWHAQWMCKHPIVSFAHIWTLENWNHIAHSPDCFTPSLLPVLFLGFFSVVCSSIIGTAQPHSNTLQRTLTQSVPSPLCIEQHCKCLVTLLHVVKIITNYFRELCSEN